MIPPHGSHDDIVSNLGKHDHDGELSKGLLIVKAKSLGGDRDEAISRVA
jgi:hypothetical protein